MKVKLLYAILLFSTISCKQSEIISQPLEDKILTSKTVFIEQRIDGEIVSRPVIIETSAEIDHLKSYPIVIALHGRGAQTQIGYSPFLSSQIRASLLGYIHKVISTHGI